MRSLILSAVLAGVFGSLATTAFAADLDDYPPPPRPYYEPHPVPPAFIPERVPPVYYRAPVILRRPVVYPRPYPYYGPGPVVRVYGERGGYGRPYAEGPGPGYGREAGIDRRDGGFDREGLGREGLGREGLGREGLGHEGYGREGDGRDRFGREGRGYERDGRGYGPNDERREHEQRYGHYLSREELDRRADRGHGYDDRFADRGAPGRDFDR